MSKKHVVSVGYMKFGFDSIKAATDLVALLSKATPLDYEFDHPLRGYKPADDERCRDIELTLNQHFHPKRAAKTEKPLALPKPKRGTILCICEKSSVAPGETMRPLRPPFQRVPQPRPWRRPTQAPLDLIMANYRFTATLNRKHGARVFKGSAENCPSMSEALYVIRSILIEREAFEPDVTSLKITISPTRKKS
jgi:hypothetical protein